MVRVCVRERKGMRRKRETAKKISKVHQKIYRKRMCGRRGASKNTIGAIGNQDCDFLKLEFSAKHPRRTAQYRKNKTG